jgi:phosphoglucosamine mutase
MKEGSFNLGGEQSGHIVMRDYVTTGDGLIAGLQFLGAVVQSGKRASELAQVFEPYPQILKNVRYSAEVDPMDNVSVKQAIEDGEAALGAKGRLLIRKSGTEPLVRVMGECEDAGLLHNVISDVMGAVSTAAK